jgi:tetratricopeptide (TPR) repeat protein
MRYLWVLLLATVASNALADSCLNEYENLRKHHTKIIKTYPSIGQKGGSELLTLKQRIEKVLVSCPNSPQILSLAAEVCINLGRNTEASAYGKKAVTAGPNDWEANSIYAMALSLLNQHEQGLNYLEMAHKLAPDKYKPSVLASLCSQYEEAKKYPKAIETCTEVIKKGDRELQGPGHYIRGRAYMALKMKDKAEEDFAKAKSLGFEGDKYYSDEHYGK